MVWFSLLVFQLTYGKFLVTGIGLKSVWSPVLYTNALSIVPTGIIGMLSGDFSNLSAVDWTLPGAPGSFSPERLLTAAVAGCNVR